jgi:hypothetical protein
MATVTLGIQTVSTSNTNSYASASFTPALNDLLVVIVNCSGSVHTAAPGTVTDSQGLGFTKLISGGYNSGADSIWVFVANKLTANSAMTVTFDCTGDNATACVIGVFRISGGDGTYVRQVAVGSGAASSAPSATFALAANTNNCIVAVAGNGANPAALTPPGGTFAEIGDTGVGTPPTGQEAARSNSGHTSATVTWGATSGTAWGAAIVEIYTSGQGAMPDCCVGSGYYGGITEV